MPKPQEFFRIKVSALGLAVTLHLVLGFFIVHSKGAAGPAHTDTDSSTITISFVEKENSTGDGKLSQSSADKSELNIQENKATIISPIVDATAGFPISRSNKEKYFRMSELTEKPLVLEDIPPDLGGLLPDVEPQTATIRLLISAAGHVDRVLLDDSALPNFAEHIIQEVFSKVKFRPGKIDGVAVKSELKIEVMIEPEPISVHGSLARRN